MIKEDLKYLIECQKTILEAQRQTIVLQQQMLNKNYNLNNQEEKLEINKPQNGTFYGLKIVRSNKGWSQSDLARALKAQGDETRQGTISKWEAGRINPRRETIYRLAQVFGLSVENFIEEVRDGCEEMRRLQ